MPRGNADTGRGERVVAGIFDHTRQHHALRECKRRETNQEKKPTSQTHTYVIFLPLSHKGRKQHKKKMNSHQKRLCDFFAPLRLCGKKMNLCRQLPIHYITQRPRRTFLYLPNDLFGFLPFRCYPRALARIECVRHATEANARM